MCQLFMQLTCKDEIWLWPKMQKLSPDPIVYKRSKCLLDLEAVNIYTLQLHIHFRNIFYYLYSGADGRRGQRRNQTQGDILRLGPLSTHNSALG